MHLPFFAGVTAGLAAYHSGSGPSQRSSSARLPASSSSLLGRIAFTSLRSPLMRAALALIFALPAAVAGYYAARGLAQLIVLVGGLARCIAIAGATIVATTAVMRMWLSSAPDAERGVAAGQTSPHLPAIADQRGVNSPSLKEHRCRPVSLIAMRDVSRGLLAL